jgi:threonine/homoserine/homoserine lactone efflux protein
MPDPYTLLVFCGAALVLAVVPGPGLFYVVGRTLAAGSADGVASCLGAMCGGLVHVGAGAVGVSAVLMESATAFSALKICGGVYLLFLAVQAWRSSSSMPSLQDTQRIPVAHRAFRHAVIVEATNPKTAGFFLALIPQFVVPERGSVALQFIVFGLISVALNTGADLVAVVLASSLRGRLAGNGNPLRRIRKASAVVLAALGISVFFSRRPV